MKEPMQSSKKSPKVLKVLLAVLALFLAGGLYFIYFVVPEKVAQTIMSKAPIHKPLSLTPKGYGLTYRDVSYTGKGVILWGGWFPGSQKRLSTVVVSHRVFTNSGQGFRWT